MISNERLIGLGLVELKDTVEASAPLVKRFKSAYVYIRARIYTFDPARNTETPKEIQTCASRNLLKTHAVLWCHPGGRKQFNEKVESPKLL